MTQCKRILALSTKQRAKTVYGALMFESTTDVHNAWRVPCPRPLYRVGPSPDKMRVVCRQTFLANYPISLATLKRLVLNKRVGLEPGVRDSPPPKGMSTPKTMQVVAWWLPYANQTSEKLPDAHSFQIFEGHL